MVTIGVAERWLVISLEEEQAHREVCLDIRSVDGSPGSMDETVELQVSVDERALVRSVFGAYQSPIFLVGREIAASLTNRRGARPGRGVKFLVGNRAASRH